MKGRFRVIVFVFLALCPLERGICIAQNNPYEIADSCYPAYVKAESLVGKADFDEFLGEFEILARQADDPKAITLVDVLRLKDAIRRNDPALTDRCLELTLASSLKSGYLQYYFYSYYLAALSYFNKDIRSKTLEILRKMREDAELMDNDYGRWYCSATLGDYYQASYKPELARKHFQEAIDVHGKTLDETIKKQPVSKLYASVASTYDYGSPEWDENMQKAYSTAFFASDSIRVYYFALCNAALNKDIPQYEHYRSLCAGRSELGKSHRNAVIMVQLIDCVVRGHWEEFSSLQHFITNMEDLRFLTSLTRTYGNIEACSKCYSQILGKVNSMNDNEIRSILDELSMQMENDSLSQLEIKQREKTNSILAITVTILLLTAFLIGFVLYAYLSKLNRIKRRAEAANNTKTRFIRNVNHEVRTPLNAIVGFTQLLLNDDELTEEERWRYGTYITNNSSLLMMLIDDILDISDVDNGDYRLTMGTCSVEEICRNAMNTVESRVPAAVQCRFENNAPEGFSILTDSRRVQQILINFLTNSCKHTSKGEIVLSVGLDEKPGCVSFSVRDSGDGVAPESADEIFHRDAALEEFKNGSGLGLKICRVIGQKLGGVVDIDRNYGRCASPDAVGARFVFHLALKQA